MREKEEQLYKPILNALKREIEGYLDLKAEFI